MGRLMKLTRRNKSAVAQQAAEWTEILKNGGSQERAAFDEWLTESPRHVREFLLISAVDRALDAVDADHKHDVQALLAHAKTDRVADLNIYRERNASIPVSRKRHWHWMGVAAALALLAAGVVHWSAMPHWQDYSTATGEQRTLQLADGSIVSLNTQSHLQVRLTESSRELRLLRGQALFKVHQDATRPFRVAAGKATIQAVGTQFDVYRHPDSTITLAVVEGRVKVTGSPATRGTSASEMQPQILSAGEEVQVTPHGTVRERARVDQASAMAWHQRRLVFRRDTLETVVEEFNRYNAKPQFRLEDARVADRHYSGEFDADDPRSLLELLASDPRLSVTRHGDHRDRKGRNRQEQRITQGVLTECGSERIAREADEEGAQPKSDD
jgi:transmembrane sensor